MIEGPGFPPTLENGNEKGMTEAIQNVGDTIPSLAIINLDMTSETSPSMYRNKFSDSPIYCFISPPGSNPRPPFYYLRFLAEGAANVIFRIRSSSIVDARIPGTMVLIQDGKGRPIDVHGHVLRVAKDNRNTRSGPEIKRDYETLIRPLFQDDDDGYDFADHLPELDPICLDSLVIDALNVELLKQQLRRQQSGKIPKNPGRLSNMALLMQDMALVAQEALSIEIKPKWLQQSPNAIPNALRCRTCALHASKGGVTNQYICPLRLEQGSATIIKPWVKIVVRKSVEAAGFAWGPPAGIEQKIVEHLATYLSVGGEGHELLKHLKHLQTKHDSGGVLKCNEMTVDLARRVAKKWQEQHDHDELISPRISDLRSTLHAAEGSQQSNLDATFTEREIEAFTSIHNLQHAMTLRDCSLFLKINYGSGDKITVTSRLGDLDFKSDAKLESWRGKEERLIGGGWYKGFGKLQKCEPCLLTATWKANVPRFW